MNRLNNNITWSRILVLALLFPTVFLASCGGDDPVVPGDTNGAPGAPAIDTASGAPADAATGIDLATDLHWTCSDPDDDALTYTVRFGTAAEPPMVEEDFVPSSYTPTGLVNGTTYHWQIVASDGSKSTSSPVWSFTTVALVAETITKPDTPGGPASGEVDDILAYTVTGGASSEGHGLEYSFDWDDGTTSDWTITMPVNHAWTLAGTYDVTALARCVEHPDAVSNNSVALQVTIDGPENVTVPMSPGGPQTPEVDVAVNYSIFGATNSRGHTLEYRVDWDDSTISDWGPGGVVDRTWTATGTYSIRAQARCQDHPDVESVWSAGLMVTVLAPETISTPDAPTGSLTGDTTETLRYDMTGAVSSHGHAVDIRFDWGAGFITAWTAEDWGATRWHNVGTYEVKVQARCHEHITILSEWSAATTVTVTEPPAETVGTPEAPTGPATGTTIEGLSYSVPAVTSSLGHSVKYVFDWGDGTVDDNTFSPNGGHTWSTAGTYDIRAMAYCNEHPDVRSDWSPTTQVSIVDATETVSGFYLGNVVDFAEMGESVFVSCAASINNLGHTMEYHFDMDDGTVTDWSTSRETNHAWSTVGTYMIRAQARCVEHPSVITDWSSDSYGQEITIHDGVETLLPAELVVGVYEVVALQSHTFTVRSASSVGHQIEGRIDWGNGEVSDWMASYNNTVYVAYTYMTSGSFEVRAQVRCATHPEIITEWSPTSTVVVSEVIIRPTITGDVTGTVGVPASYLAADAESTSGHALEYRLESGTTIYGTDYTDWTGTTALEVTFTEAGTYYVRARARCAEHPEITSGFSLEYVTIVITD